MQQCHGYSKHNFKRCKRLQEDAFCHYHFACEAQASPLPLPLGQFWRYHLDKAGISRKIDPDRAWGILLNKDNQAILGYPLGIGLSPAQMNKWGSMKHTMWVLEQDLFSFFPESRH